MLAMGQRDPGVGRAAGGGGHPRRDPERHAGGGQRLELLAAAAEDERIAALEPQYPLAGAGEIDQKPIDAGLGADVAIAHLADEDPFHPGRHQLEDVGADQAVVDHDVGLPHQAQRLQGEQLGAARPGADQIDLAPRRRGAWLAILVGHPSTPPLMSRGPPQRPSHSACDRRCTTAHRQEALGPRSRSGQGRNA